MKLYLFLLLLLPSLSYAYDLDTDLMLSDLASPITTDSKYIFTGGLLTTAILLIDKDHDLDNQAKDKIEIKQNLGTTAYIGEAIGWGYLNAIYTLAYSYHFYKTGNNKSAERAEIMFSSSLLTFTNTVLLKFAINRRRPNYPDRNDSFPSGHASMAFNFASVVTAEHGLAWGGLVHLIASYISYSRMHDGWHWLSDVTAGAAIGASYGWGVYLNRRKLNPRFWLVPAIEPKTSSLGVRFGTNF